MRRFLSSSPPLLARDRRYLTILDSVDPNAASQPCSYCLRTRKKCTLEWATRLHRQSHLRSPTSGKSRAKAKSTIHHEPSIANTASPDEGLQANFAFTSPPGPIFREPAVPDFGVFPNFNDGNLLDLSLFNHTSHKPPDIPLDSATSSSLLSEPLSGSASYLSEPSPGKCLGASTTSQSTATLDWQESCGTLFQLPWEMPVPSAATQELGCLPQMPVHDDGTSLVDYDRRHRRPNDTNRWTGARGPSLSPFSPNQAIASKSTHQFISSGLLRIYHDVLENNLTCWLTETTCPYKTRNLAADPVDSPDIQREWGSTWSNRMYGRTVQLDRGAMARGMIHLTPSENQAASRALSLAIAAFAAQWAQGSRRHRETYSARMGSSNTTNPDLSESGAPGVVGEEFDRSIQRQLWEQARAALQRVSEVESFRVASAEIIFGLTQKPFGSEDRQHPDLDIFAGLIGVRGLKSRVWARLNAFISAEGPPLYMERAARKMQALKSRFDSSHHHRFGSGLHGCGLGTAGKSRSFLNYEDRATIDLLYWLAVMFDTISASMNDRPVVVSDEESQHHASPEHNHTVPVQSSELGAIGRWNIDLFIQDNIHAPKQILVWPCSYEEVADAVIKSAPIKVLLFRHISYLQRMIRNGVRGKSIDELIDTTTSVYRYWEMTYGSFFRSLVGDIDLIPFRIQGWFSCISAHWHLAALMLGDLIDFVDSNKLGTPFGTQSRTVMKTASTIRDHTIKDLSDLAKISTPRSEGAGYSAASSLPEVEFHHAVNECVILTEPWTIILIKAFSSASAILLGAVEESVTDGCPGLGWADEELTTKLGMAEECIKALWHLGKKSDLSRKSAEILSVALSKLHVYLGAS